MIALPAVILIHLAFKAYYAILLTRVILSFVRLPSYHPFQRTVGRFCEAATEPLLAPLRRALMRYQAGTGFDFSPLILWLLLGVAEGMVVKALVG